MRRKVRGGMKRFSHSYLATVLGVSLGISLAVPSTGFASQDPESLTAQQMEYAKSQFADGEALYQGGDYKGAVKKYETAYQYAPSLHVLNFNIGLASFEGGDCSKAKIAFQRFLDLVPDHPMRGEAQTQLMAIERRKCGAAPSRAGGSATPPMEDDPPELKAQATVGEDPGTEEPTEEDTKPKAPAGPKQYQFNGLMKGGLAMAGAGGALVITGAISIILARVAAVKLGDMGREKSITGFTPHSYADDEVFKLDRRRRILGPTSLVLLGGGVAIGGTGLAVYLLGLKKCKSGEKTARRGRLQLTGLTPAVLRSGGGVGASFAFAGPSRGLSADRASSCR